MVECRTRQLRQVGVIPHAGDLHIYDVMSIQTYSDGHLRSLATDRYFSQGLHV